MELLFPSDFIFGTSTAATQIETAFEHDWQGIKAKDGFVFDRTTDHELRSKEDIEIISSLAPYYRMSLMWSKLQRAPMAELDPATVAHYKSLLKRLKENKVNIMMVLHHFTNPLWFSRNGGWENENNIPYWVDYAKKVVKTFGKYVSYWNTFNEPNVYASFGWVAGFFPPFKKHPVKAAVVVRNMGKAHDLIYDYIKEKSPDQPVGISHNCVVFSQENVIGWFSARLSDWWFMDFIPAHFEKCDFFGMSYYARISHDPMPITWLETPHKMDGKIHDDIWEYHPEGLRECIDRYWNKYHKPIIITESGVCDASDQLRQKAIVDYAQIIHKALQDGIDIKGYFWWSTWDNFEWHLGPSMKFGLYECDPVTMERKKRPSAEIFRKLAWNKMI
ncbi:MAG TPA: family 1 glycosylhydrolase [Cyclobacteriaceae bacterium]|nr:family 1 glycosylhydrolase [Cyclobacteriaceae bacterium]